MAPGGRTVSVPIARGVWGLGIGPGVVEFDVDAAVGMFYRAGARIRVAVYAIIAGHTQMRSMAAARHVDCMTGAACHSAAPRGVLVV